MNNTHQNTVEVTVLADKVQLKLIEKALDKRVFSQRYKDVLFIGYPKSFTYIFDYGAVVFWSVTEERKAYLLDILKTNSQLHDELHTEVFPYRVEASATVTMLDDEILINAKEQRDLLAISHALAQSAKLEQFESRAERTIKDNAYLSASLAKTGKIPLSRKELAKLRGNLFKTKSDILLHYSLLDTPDFFWQNPDLESIYQALAKYLELVPRVELLTLKLETIHELLEMLAAEQNHKHSAFLEWIIIILIAVDIAVYFGH